MPGGGRDGVMRRRGDGVIRFLHVNGRPATVRAWATRGGVRLVAEAEDRDCASAATERMRFALGTDHDLSDFHRAFWRDPLLGPILRRKPWLRPRRRPEPFEALAWAICEQLIDGPRAVSIQRRLTARHGAVSPCGGLRDVPSAEAIAGASPAQLEACGLSPRRAITMVKAAREVATGRTDLAAHEPAWKRLRSISGIGPWTVECLALHGQGRDDQLPAGDLAYIKLVGRLQRLGRRATEDEVREFFAPYAPFAGLAGTALVNGWGSGMIGAWKPT
jgi:3-methyladenine DNA glycosylase/8-oxoguanine DNA glycosylase